MDGADNWQGRGGDEEVMRYFVTGAPIIYEFLELLQGLSPKLKEVPTVEKCDFILVFPPSVSEAKTAIESALLELHHTELTKPVLLVVLHYTLDGDISISDSSEYLRESTLTVDCLISNDENLLQCTKNDEALTKAKEWIQSEIEKKKPEIQHEHPCASIDLANQTGTEEECDVVLHDIDEAEQILNDLPASRLAVLFVLHYTSDPNIRVSDSRSVNRRNTLTVDCLISEDKRFLNCPQNEKAVCKVSDWLNCEVAEETSTDYTPQVETKPVKIVAHITGRTKRFFEEFVKILCKQTPTLQVSTVEESTKPAVPVMLHHTPNPDLTVSDSHRAVTREKTLTVDFLFCEDKVLLKCAQNDNAPPEESKPTQPKGRNKRPCQSPPVKTKPVNIFSCVTGKTLGSHEDFVRILCKRRTALQEVLTVEECDVVLVFCPVVSRAGTDIEAALQELSGISATKPAVLVVLHHTFNQELTVTDSSRAVNREKTLTVDCLFYEDEGLLQCIKNDEALCKVADWLIPEGSKPPKSTVKEDQPNEPPPVETKPVNIFSCVTGKTLGSHEDFVRILCKRRTALQEVLTVEECEVVLVFCPVVSRAGTDIEAALQELSDISATKPAVLVVLHHTFNQELNVPDSSRTVNREKTLTVDCLFYEDEGLLQCIKNDEALCKVADWLIPEGSKPPKSTVKEDQPNEPPPVETKPVNIFSCVTGKTLGSHEDFVRILCKRRTALQEVLTVEECEVVLVFCPVVSRAGTDIEAALQELSDISATKPAVLVVLHHTFNQELNVPDSSRTVNREKTLTVDCLFYEDEGLLQCIKNDEALCKVADWLIPEVKEDQPNEPPPVKTKPVNIFSCVTGKTLGSHEDFVRILCKRRTALQEVLTVEECDVVLVFCPVVSQAGTDIEAALQELSDISATKPAVLVVLHHTLNPDLTVPDSSRAVNREKTLTVDCLFYEDEGLLQCRKNDEAFRDFSVWIDTEFSTVLHQYEDHSSFLESTADTIQTYAQQALAEVSTGIKQAMKPIGNSMGKISEKTRMLWNKIPHSFSLPQKNKGSSSVTGVSQDLPQVKLCLGKLNFFTCVTGNTLGSHMEFVRILCKRRAELQEVPTVEECDVILAFCPVVSAAGIDTKNALQQLNDVAGSRPVVLVVLHHTFDPELIVPDSSRSVNREETLTVDCLFHEDKGLLQCRRNDEALSRVSEWIESQIEDKERMK
ncbi:hypothetical protein SRHO_G00286800 [Serrasalmus rhombeus]